MFFFLCFSAILKLLMIKYGADIRFSRGKMLGFENFAELLKVILGLTSLEEKCLSYNFIYEVYGKNASHTNFIQNLKSVLKIFNEHFWSACLFWSFLVIKKLFCSILFSDRFDIVLTCFKTCLWNQEHTDTKLCSYSVHSLASQC